MAASYWLWNVLISFLLLDIQGFLVINVLHIISCTFQMQVKMNFRAKENGPVVVFALCCHIAPVQAGARLSHMGMSVLHTGAKTGH